MHWTLVVLCSDVAGEVGEEASPVCPCSRVPAIQEVGMVDMKVRETVPWIHNPDFAA